MTTAHRDYDPSKGNIFTWLLEECGRQRYWEAHKSEPLKALPKPSLHSLRSLHGRYAVLVVQCEESGFDAASKDPLKVLERRKL